VPCVGCTADMFSSDEGYRIENLTSSQGTEYPFAIKNNCDGATFTTGIYNLATIFVIIVGMLITSMYLQRKEVAFDEDEQTAQDYSIKILNPLEDARDPLEWKQFFGKKFGVHVTVCTIVMDNDVLIKKLVYRRELLQKIKTKVGPSYDMDDMDALQKVASDIESKRNILQRGLAKIFAGVPESFARIGALDDEIKTLASEEKNVTKVFITFETEAAQRKVLSILPEKEDNENYSFRKEIFLQVAEPAEPSAIRWKDLNKSNQSRWARFIIPTLLTGGSIIAAAFLVNEMRAYGALYAAVTISVLNYVCPTAAKALTNTEIHPNEGSKQASLYIKIAIFRWVNTAIVTTVITVSNEIWLSVLMKSSFPFITHNLLQPFTSTIMPGEDHLLAGVYAIFFSEIVTVTALQMLDVGSNFRRHFFAPRAETQEDMDGYMTGTVVELAERYTVSSLIFFLVPSKMIRFNSLFSF